MGSLAVDPRRERDPRIRSFLWSLAVGVGVCAPLTAQTLSPRAFWPGPRNTKVVSVGGVYQEGDVLTDPSLPVEGTESETRSLSAGYLQYFDLAGRTASANIEVPWVSTSLDAMFGRVGASRDIKGFADLSLRMAVNLRGAPTMSVEEFRKFVQHPKPILGVSLEVVAPTGVYESDRIANLGSNRWAAKPTLGYIRQIRPGWTVEMALGAWFYGDNTDFLGQRREQEPLVAGEFHLIRPVRRSRPDFWVSLDLNFFSGARTRTDGEQADNDQNNSRIGITALVPFAGSNALKVAVSTSLVTEKGGDYSSLIVAYQKAWR